jgi:hypothetical protein
MLEPARAAFLRAGTESMFAGAAFKANGALGK